MGHMNRQRQSIHLMAMLEIVADVANNVMLQTRTVKHAGTPALFVHNTVCTIP